MKDRASFFRPVVAHIARFQAAALTAFVATALLAPHAADAGADVPRWSDDFVSRVEVLALLQSLNADLLSHDSATLTLDRWCNAHRLAAPAAIVAERLREAARAPTAEQRELLRVGPDEPVGYRHVRLRCGAHILSEADNWYVPARLTPAMNQVLETTDVPFGRAIQDLHFLRRTLTATMLWSPLPEGWEMRPNEAAPPSGTPLAMPERLLQHRALLTLPDGSPVAAVVETYTRAVLVFPQAP